jgi:UDP-GlcNAc3NAcA epimerase
MPEEINRVLTDHLSTWLFTVSDVGVEHLAREGITTGVHTVGDVGADALELYREQAVARTTVRERLGVVRGDYYLATVHRAENTDDPRRLRGIFEGLGRLGEPVVIPLHPRTRDRLAELAIPLASTLRTVSPLGYLDMLALQAGATCVLTDSGGVQREAYYLRVPCVTLRDETEWVETVAAGWNVLAGADPERIVSAARARPDPGRTHPRLYGDGATAPRIAAILSTCAASPRS